MNNFTIKFSLILFFLFLKLGFSQTGINTLIPKSTLDVNGNISVKTMNLKGSNAPTPIIDGVYISVNPQAQDQVFNLPSAVTYPGRFYYIRNINSSYTAAISATSGQFFYKDKSTEADPTGHKIYLYEGNRTVFVISDGTNWTVFN